MDTADIERLLGVVAVVVSLGSVLLATVVSPSFDWTAHALSNLGVPATDPGTETTALLFDGGLILGGLLGLGFAHRLYREAGTGLGTVVAALLGLTVVTMAAIGVFPQGHSLHFPVAAGFFLLFAVTLLTAGVRAFVAGDTTWTLVSVGLATADLGAWVVWGLTGSIRRSGLAMPEIVGAVAFGAWVLLAVRRSARS